MSTFKDQGNNAFKAKNFNEAISFYTKAVDENPTDHTIFGNRSAAHYSLQQWEQAIEDAQKCIDIKPDWSKGYQRKGMAMEGKGDLEEAIKLYETGIDKDPANAQCK